MWFPGRPAWLLGAWAGGRPIRTPSPFGANKWPPHPRPPRRAQNVLLLNAVHQGLPPGCQIPASKASGGLAVSFPPARRCIEAPCQELGRPDVGPSGKGLAKPLEREGGGHLKGKVVVRDCRLPARDLTARATLRGTPPLPRRAQKKNGITTVTPKDSTWGGGSMEGPGHLAVCQSSPPAPKAARMIRPEPRSDGVTLPSFVIFELRPTALAIHPKPT